MNIRVDDNNEVLLGVQTDDIDLRAGDTTILGSSDYEDLTNKPSIEGVELVGDVSLDDLGAACAEDIPTDVSELINDAGYITSEDIPPIPEKTSDLTNDSGFITEDDIPPLVIDGTNYPITAITKASISGVSGVLVDYDDGNSGQLFFADGVGLNTVKTVIEGAIPHDTSELNNGAGFLTISDLPIYDGGVS